MEEVMTLKPIGKIRSPYKQKFGTPRQSGLVSSARAEILLDSDRVPPGSLDGLQGFSHIWLIFQFHKNDAININGKIRPPRLDGEKIGFLATRTPHRPNSLGLSVVELIEINPEKNSLMVQGIDLIDQTPILDIKPYIKDYDSIENTRQDWVDETKSEKLVIEWKSPDLFENLNLETKKLIEETLCFDLRNLEDKTKNDESKIHKSFIDQYDVHFCYEANKVIIVSTQKVPGT